MAWDNKRTSTRASLGRVYSPSRYFARAERPACRMFPAPTTPRAADRLRTCNRRLGRASLCQLSYGGNIPLWFVWPAGRGRPSGFSPAKLAVHWSYRPPWALIASVDSESTRRRRSARGSGPNRTDAYLRVLASTRVRRWSAFDGSLHTEPRIWRFQPRGAPTNTTPS